MSATKTFAVGDKVTWTHVKTNGHRMNFSTREGTIMEMNNVVATIKQRNGRLAYESLSNLTPAGEMTALTRSFMPNKEEGK